MKTEPNTVTIDRPPAKVTIVIQGTTHVITEKEARDLHGRLGAALGVNSTPLADIIRRAEPARWKGMEPRYVQEPPKLPPGLQPYCGYNLEKPSFERP